VKNAKIVQLWVQPKS